MTAHGVVRFDKPQFTDLDSLNRVGVCATALDNGWVAQLLSQGTAASGQTEVWTATVPTSANSGLKNLWMAASPEIVLTTVGNNSYKGLDADPQNFSNVVGQMIDFVRLEIGDILTMTAECFTNAQNTYAVATNNDWTLNFSGSNPGTGLTLKYLATTFISKGVLGAVSETQQVTAYKMQVIATA
jgi:hypothetical protein